MRKIINSVSVPHFISSNFRYRTLNIKREKAETLLSSYSAAESFGGFNIKKVIEATHKSLTMKTLGLVISLALLATLTAGVRIQCIYQNMNWAVGDLYSCIGTVISTESPAIITEVSGFHLTGRNNSDVKGFDIVGHQILSTIPARIDSFFSNLEVFRWFIGNISTIDSSVFAPHPNLLLIILGSNNLVALDSDLFHHTRKLREIHFNHNKLQHVGHDLLAGLTDLTHATFISNPCISSWVNNSQQIQELNRQLPIQCPPLALATTPNPPTTAPDPPTTTISTTSAPNECPIRCTMNDEADWMKKRIEEIERQMREIQSNPCSCRVK